VSALKNSNPNVIWAAKNILHTLLEKRFALIWNKVEFEIGYAKIMLPMY
jgi:hypothetical protein